MPLVAGVDCSTQSTKVLVVDADTGSVVAAGSRPHSVQGTGGARETDPAVWEQALAGALADTGKARELAAISVAGQQHGLVVVDAEGRPLRPAMLWNDVRAAEEAGDLTAALGGPQGAAERIGSVPTPAFTAPKWAWLRAHEPEVARSTKGIRLPHDHMNACLTGRAATDRSDVSGTAWWSPRDEEYAAEVLDLPAIAVDPGLLPPVIGAQEDAGRVNAAGAERFGLRQGALVGAGSGDNAGSALALDLQPGEIAVSLGTSGTTFAVTTRPSADPSGMVAGFASADGRYLPLACTLNATLALDRVAAWLSLDREQVEPAAGLVFLPWLDGERTPDLPAAAGNLWGLRHSTSGGSILQAAYEGLVATVLQASDLLVAEPDPAAPLLLVGGGAQGRAWLETVRRLSGRPVVVPQARELVAMGAAIVASAVATGSDPRAVAAAWGLRKGPEHQPLEIDRGTVDKIRSWMSVASEFAQKLTQQSTGDR